MFIIYLYKSTSHIEKEYIFSDYNIANCTEYEMVGGNPVNMCKKCVDGYVLSPNRGFCTSKYTKYIYITNTIYTVLIF